MKKNLSLVISICILMSLICPTLVSGAESNDAHTIKNTVVTQTSKPLADENFQKNYWAVLIGINDYPGTYRDLPYSVNEILSFQNTLLDGGNWLDPHIRVLTNNDATIDGIFEALKWLDENEGENDISIFYYAGHGSKNSSAELLDVYDGYISDSDLDAKLDDMEGQMVIILDSCFSGGFIEEVGEKGRVVLTACQKDNFAYQDLKLKSGIFGYFVNFSLKKITKAAEGTFLVAYIASVIYSKKLSRESGRDFTIYPCIYDGIFGRTKIIEHHSYVKTFLPGLFPMPSRNNSLRIWKM